MVTDDKLLVARVVASQDSTAFGELVRRHQSQVRNFLRKLARDHSTADDLAQDCFVHACDKMHTYAGSGSFIGWLLKVAYTTFLQAKRKSKRYHEVLEEVGHVAADEAASYTQQSTELADLDKFLAILSDEDRAVMVLSYACGLSHREISDATSMPVGTVKSVIYRAKEKIRTSFEIEDHKHG